jgi:hypothetical protein
MAQQTAVEWLVEELKSKGHALITSKGVFISVPDDLLLEAKAMEKQQMHKCASFWRGKENEIEKPMFEIYYNETYNK